ncbi:MAG TPA: hypothetical protein VHX65_19305 [Pirellulales bacterium]|nr:hypothetical protein [Pirellulales bacterium]
MGKDAKTGNKAIADRRGPKSSDRRSDDRRQKSVPVPVERRQLERRTKVSRRRQIDPTTCEREYTDDELQFMQALETYKRTSGRMFPTCSEVLEVLRGLGYSKNPQPAPSGERSPNEPIAVALPAGQPGFQAIQPQVTDRGSI